MTNAYCSKKNLIDMFTNNLLEMNASNEIPSLVQKRKRVEFIKPLKPKMSHPSDDIFIFVVLVLLIYLFVTIFTSYSSDFT
jgi:hypothetical protein